jgi:ElaB/YqjD/DUF883 family membrane-anchored ribosome-binding protein
MADTRRTLARKIATLEDAVVDTARGVQSAVDETIHTAREEVESFFDCSRRVRENPWGMVCGATAAGFLTGAILNGPCRSGTAKTETRRIVSDRQSTTNGLLDRMSEKARELGESALETLTNHLRRVLDEGIPKVVDRVLEPPSPGTNGVATHPIGRWADR